MVTSIVITLSSRNNVVNVDSGVILIEPDNCIVVRQIGDRTAHYAKRMWKSVQFQGRRFDSTSLRTRETTCIVLRRKLIVDTSSFYRFFVNQ